MSVQQTSLPCVLVYEDHLWQQFLPLVYTRAVFELICGMCSLASRVRHLTGDDSRWVGEADSEGVPDLPEEGTPLDVWCRPALAEVVAEQTGFRVNRPVASPTLLLGGRGLWHHLPDVVPTEPSWVGVCGTHPNPACVFAAAELAATLSPQILLDESLSRAVLAGLPRRDVSDCVSLFEWPWNFVLANERALIADWETGGRHRRALDGQIAAGAHLLRSEAIHVGQGTRIKPCVVIDAEEGPVWIGKNVTILPHSYVQGPAFIGDGCLLQPGAVVHAGSTIGPHCKIGGEIETSILQGFSNKQHDGFLGHSYVGSWVNLAADCINSDLKNTYGTVRVPINGVEVETNEMFVGMLMGDHSKAGINVSFPTGAVIGFGSSVFATRSPKFVPSFTWVEESTTQPYDTQRGLALAQRVMARRGRTMTSAGQQAFLAVCDLASSIEVTTSS